MAVELIIEDGSGVDAANSYGIDTSDATSTLAAARQYAINRGVDLGSDDDALKVQLINGTDYLESLADYFVGRQTDPSQALSWPRKYVRINHGPFLPDNTLPIALLYALYQLCIEQQNGILLLPTDNTGASGGFVIMSKVDVIETRFSETLSSGGLDASMPKVDALLSGITNNRMGAAGLTAIRG